MTSLVLQNFNRCRSVAQLDVRSLQAPAPTNRKSIWVDLRTVSALSTTGNQVFFKHSITGVIFVMRRRALYM